MLLNLPFHSANFINFNGGFSMKLDAFLQKFFRLKGWKLLKVGNSLVQLHVLTDSNWRVPVACTSATRNLHQIFPDFRWHISRQSQTRGSVCATHLNRISFDNFSWPQLSINQCFVRPPMRRLFHVVERIKRQFSSATVVSFVWAFAGGTLEEFDVTRCRCQWNLWLVSYRWCAV